MSPNAETMAQIAEHFDVYYMTVCRAVPAIEEQTGRHVGMVELRPSPDRVMRVDVGQS